jgi:hypothetical protein
LPLMADLNPRRIAADRIDQVMRSFIRTNISCTSEWLLRIELVLLCASEPFGLVSSVALSTKLGCRRPHGRFSK